VISQELAMVGTVLVYLLAAGGAGALAEQFEFGFQQEVRDHPALRLSGPNAQQVARADGRGLRIALPTDRSDLNGVGVDTRFRVGGDFEITLEYEIVSLPKEAPAEGCGVALLLKFEKPSTGRAMLTRLRKGAAEVFGASRIVPGKGGKDRYQTQNVPATGLRGKLRLARSGSTLKYLVAEGPDEFREIHSVDVGTEDVTELRAQVRTGHKPASADVRLVHWSIHADSLPDRPTIKPTVQHKWTWLFWTVFATLLLGLGGGTAFYFWKQRG
jgi:hypothetical protein